MNEMFFIQCKSINVFIHTIINFFFLSNAILCKFLLFQTNTTNRFDPDAKANEQIQLECFEDQYHPVEYILECPGNI